MGVSLTNDSGGQSISSPSKRVFGMKTKQENYLADASFLLHRNGRGEKGCFFSEGQLFLAVGALTVTG